MKTIEKSRKVTALAMGVYAFSNLAPLASRANDGSLDSSGRSDLEYAALATVAGLIGICGISYGVNKMLTRKTPTWPKPGRQVR